MDAIIHSQSGIKVSWLPVEEKLDALGNWPHSATHAAEKTANVEQSESQTLVLEISDCLWKKMMAILRQTHRQHGRNPVNFVKTPPLAKDPQPIFAANALYLEIMRPA